MEKTLYALVTSHCNLTCPYCDIRECKETFNRDLFMKQLHDFDGSIILFGGEPTLYEDRLLDICYSDPLINRKIYSITTNLMNVSDKVLTVIQTIGRCGTSWNPDRFTDEQYKVWINNLNVFADKLDMGLGILITMVDSVLDLSPYEFINIISEWNTKTVRTINFEYLVSDTTNPEYFDRCDKWLCNIYKNWNTPIKLINEDRVFNWYEDCSGHYTLHPDGSITKGCPHHMSPRVPIECMTCERANICKPCQLQSYCSFPKKFYELVKSTKDN